MRYIRPIMTQRTEALLPWQWKLYPDNHVTRRNLVLHIVTVPLFQVGTLLLVASPLLGLGWALAGLGGMVAAVALQGRGHRLETVPPVPFQGPGDVVARIFVEQWVTFPRFVLSGGFARAWRATRS
jgi:hypothetical protein